MTTQTIASWPDDRQLAVVFNVAYEAWADDGAPGIGPMGNPLPAGTVDTQARAWGRYAYKRGIQRLGEILDRHGVSATILTSGCLAELAPETLRDLHAAGHDLCAHSYSQDIVPVGLAPDDERRHIARCVDLLASVTGEHPRGWMSPRGTPSPATGALLVEAGFDWHGDCFDDDVPYLEHHEGGDLVAIPFTMEINDLPVNLRHGNPPHVLLQVFRDTLKRLRERETGPIHLDVTVHAHVFGRPSGAWVYEAIMEEVVADPDIWVPTRSQIATWTRSQLSAS